MMSNNEFSFVDRSYGKSFVKLLHVKRDGKVHHIKEYEVGTLLTLDNDKDYTQGDNADIVATDSQKNTVYLLAKKHGVGCPEQFAILVAKHFVQTYSWVIKADVTVESVNAWKRIQDNHNHAFVSVPTSTRWARVVQVGRHSRPLVTAGLKGLKLLKTTQSAFVDFVSDSYRSLPDMSDRVFSTVVDASWTYRTLNGLDFCKAYNEVERAIEDNFAGPSDSGIFSASVQKTLYDTQVQALKSVGQMDKIYVAMPNKHYFTIDLSRFPKSVGGSSDNNEVFLPVDKPSGLITATLARSDFKSRL